ncbi:MAG: hypothetical protein ACLU5J_09175 [Christensenellales bacterium]
MKQYLSCSITEPETLILLSYITQIEYYLNQIKATIIKMNQLASKLPLL